MKFVVAVVMLALAVGVQSSILPLAAHYAPAVSYVSSVAHPVAHYGGAWDDGHYDGRYDGHYDNGYYGGHYGPAAVAVHHGAWGLGLGHLGIPGISLSQGPHIGHAAIGHGLGYGLGHGLGLGLGLGHGHGHEGVYVAKTRGAVHTAPLAGHINSATSINLAPAPGTH